MCELDALVRAELLDLQHTLSESCRRAKPNRSLGTRDTNIYKKPNRYRQMPYLRRKEAPKGANPEVNDKPNDSVLEPEVNDKPNDSVLEPKGH